MSEEKNKNGKRSFFLALPFLLTLAVITVISYLIPLRPTFSDSEKRALTKFPEFSVSALVSGDYFDEITLWFSDTFPGREKWVDLSQYVASFHGYSEIAIEGTLAVSDEIPVVQIPTTMETEAVQESSLPDPETETPTVPETNEPDGEEETATDPEETQPEEGTWGAIEVNVNEIYWGTAIQIGDAGYNQFGFSKVQSDRYIAAVNKFADRMAEKGVRVISAPAPTSVGIMIPKEYLPQIKSAPQDEMLAYLHGSMNENVITVDTVANLAKHNKEYIYFRTDHHWTALGAYYAYEALCDTLGYEAAPLDSFTLWNQGDFIGSLYGKVRWPHKLRIDTLDCYVPQGDITMYAYFGDENQGTEWPLIADRTNQSVNSRYSAFLASDCPLAHVVNESLPDAPNCLVLKDSFGNCFVPYLTQNYHNVYAIDYRKYGKMSMERFVETYEIDDVILAPYLIATQSIQGNDLFGNQLR